MKKMVIIVTILVMMFLGYEGYLLYGKYHKIINLENELKEKANINEEYVMLLDSITMEVGSFDKIEDKVGLLERNYSENEELLSLLEEDLERLQKENNSVEKMIIQIEEEIERRKNQKIISGNFTYSQFPNYPTGCESVALYLLLKYNGIDTTVNDIITNLKKGELPYKITDETYGGNPEIEFVGDPRNDYSYGVYNGPIRDVANLYKSGINSRIGMEFDEVLDLVKEDKAVMVWTTINLAKPYISKTWIYKETGEKISWIAREHAMVVIGYNDSKVIVSDPYTGTIRYFDKELFKLRYDYLGKRALYY